MIRVLILLAEVELKNLPVVVLITGNIVLHLLFNKYMKVFTTAESNFKTFS